MDPAQRDELRPLAPGVDDRQPGAHRDDDVTDPRGHLRPDITEPPLRDGLGPRADRGTRAEPAPPGRDDVVERPGADVELCLLYTSPSPRD